MRLIDADALKRKAQKVATEAWKMRIKSSVETILNQFIDWIDDADTVDTESQWIPCRERLPDVDQRVLLSGHGMVMVGMLHSFGKYSLEPTGISHVYPKDDIEAWMPLPPSYKGEDNEND